MQSVEVRSRWKEDVYRHGQSLTLVKGEEGNGKACSDKENSIMPSDLLRTKCIFIVLEKRGSLIQERQFARINWLNPRALMPLPTSNSNACSQIFTRDIQSNAILTPYSLW